MSDSTSLFLVHAYTGIMKVITSRPEEKVHEKYLLRKGEGKKMSPLLSVQ